MLDMLDALTPEQVALLGRALGLSMAPYEIGCKVNYNLLVSHFYLTTTDVVEAIDDEVILNLKNTLEELKSLMNP